MNKILKKLNIPRTIKPTSSEMFWLADKIQENKLRRQLQIGGDSKKDSPERKSETEIKSKKSSKTKSVNRNKSKKVSKTKSVNRNKSKKVSKTKSVKK